MKATKSLLLAFSLALTEPAAIVSATTPTIYSKPVEAESINLDGSWDVKLSPKGRWHKAIVPGELAMQGLAPEHDTPVTYRKKINIPSSWSGSKIILRFDGTYSYATLLINGKEIRKHRGGFTRWDTYVTPFIKPGRTNEVELQLTDPVDEISYASGYAHHPVGGILRSVGMFTQPESFISDLKADASLDSTYTDGRIDVRFSHDRMDGKRTQVEVAVIDSDGSTVRSEAKPVMEGLNSIALDVEQPKRWDAEHPNLYTLRLEFKTEGKPTATVEKQIGFRNIEVDGNRLLVNGRPVKLRGACRHDIHPTLGRSSDRTTDSIDARLFKRANMNFVRTSHYPPSEDFLEFCDRYGIYVESETAVCFVDTYRQENYQPGASQSDTIHTRQYLEQLGEMVKNYQSHPSVLMWSIGNESVYGTNFAASYEWVKSYDPSRPVIFSYPGTVPDTVGRIYDILSMHYPPVSGNMTQMGVSVRGFGHSDFPTLHDEWAHPACYTYATLRDDPGIREFWGQSLDKMWRGVMANDGALGGAIWGYVDEVFHLPEPVEGSSWWKDFAHTQKPEGFRGNCVGYGEWGIVDIYRRPKPEFHATKKAYTPILIEAPRELEVGSMADILLPVVNRFDHTNLSEVKAEVTTTSCGKTSIVAMPDVEPHGRGFIRVAGRVAEGADTLRLTFTTHSDTIDTYVFTLATPRRELLAEGAATPLTIDTTDRLITVMGNGFAIPFDRENCLMTGIQTDGREVVESGPYLNAYINYNHLTGAEIRSVADHMTIAPESWRPDSLSVGLTPAGDALAVVTGRYGDARVEYRISITAAGDMTIDYNADGLPDGYLRETGLAFRLNDAFSTLRWDRNGYWDSYPDDAMSGHHGHRPIYNQAPQPYGVKPDQPWGADTRNYYYWSDEGSNASMPLTNWAKSMKENIYLYTLEMPDGEALSVLSDKGDVACRLNKPDGNTLMLYADNRWDYPEIAWGNYCKAISPLPLTGRITLSLRRPATTSVR